ncbi:MAG: hypothetical protein LLG14_08105 [Nocardiaceae bacterium]|nr:hypothetical protein [Nocardiaceae bacterium]
MRSFVVAAAASLAIGGCGQAVEPRQSPTEASMSSAMDTAKRGDSSSSAASTTSAASEVPITTTQPTPPQLPGQATTAETLLSSPYHPKRGAWHENVVSVTTESVGAAKLGMTEEEIEEAADVQVELICTECDANMIAVLEPATQFAQFQVRHSCLGFDVIYNPVARQIVRTPGGFELGGTVAELQKTYGPKLRPFHEGVLTPVNGYSIDGDIGRVIFRISESNPSLIDAFMVWPIDGRGC